ncbi:MAG: ABC transporter ATP-binding protein [Candidatus Hydrogenedentes bacterium]|nr:ABC transporter ATP-binding protein [Candidatus Hydrogenedentota bacterium]
MAIIEAHDLTKAYPATGGKRALLGRGGLSSWFSRTAAPPPALDGVTLAIDSGEAVGIIGRNGSGKSTLLKLIAGVTAPTSGSLSVRGRVASLLELGAGFHPMLTGRENVYLNAGLLGMRHAETDACFDAIAAFADLGEFIDRTVDTYSSGMYVRLAFSVAVHSDPDIFLVDEVLSVGDEAFQRKCRARIQELRASGKTILFVSHDLGTVSALCDRVILLERGRVLSRGGAQETIDYYLRQTGGEAGIARLTHDRDEVLFNNGRLSLYRDQKEITAPAGIKAQFFSLGSYHESTSAAWTVSRTGPDHFLATGVMPRLPITLHLEASLDENGLELLVSWENHQHADIDYVAVQAFFPATYTAWFQDGYTQPLPAIEPTALHWANVIPARAGSGPAYLLPDAGSLPPIRIALDSDATRTPVQLDNTDYLAQARVAHVTEAIPGAERPLPPGRRRQAALRIAFASSEAVHDARSAAEAASTVAGDGWSARLERGFAILSAGDAIVSRERHLHPQFRVNGLWIVGQAMRWDPPRREGARILLTGDSPRAPFRVTWSLEPDGALLRLRLSIACDDPIRLEDANLSLELGAAYTRWETARESGEFDVDPQPDGSWRHLNTRYGDGGWIRAHSDTFPALIFELESQLGAGHPTAISTGGPDAGRVIQLMCNPGPAGAFELGPGSHELLHALVRFETEPRDVR